MPFGMKKSDLEKVAEAKLADAKLLLDNERYSNAYYLAGYAVEIALKAVIANMMNAHTIPDRRFIEKVYSHRLNELIGLAGLKSELDNDHAADAELKANWAIVANWTPEVRYAVIEKRTSQVMILSITESKSGVFPWIKRHW